MTLNSLPDWLVVTDPKLSLCLVTGPKHSQYLCLVTDPKLSLPLVTGPDIWLSLSGYRSWTFNVSAWLLTLYKLSLAWLLALSSGSLCLVTGPGLSMAGTQRVVLDREILVKGTGTGGGG